MREDRKKIDLAVSMFKEGYSCSQAIFSVFAEELGLDPKTAIKIATSFGGGMARMGETCGAVTGAFMAIGLKYAVGKDSKDEVYGIVKKFVYEFKSRNQSIICKELLGYNLSTPEGMKAVKEKKIIDTLCPKLVQDAAEILEKIL